MSILGTVGTGASIMGNYAAGEAGANTIMKGLEHAPGDLDGKSGLFAGLVAGKAASKASDFAADIGTKSAVSNLLASGKDDMDKYMP